LPAIAVAPAPFVAGEQAPAFSQTPHFLAHVPVSTPPRA
jgi:hypothetical protein